RPTGFAGSAISCAVSENGAKISSLPPGRFFVVVVDPGKHTYSVSSEATDQIYFDLKPGQTNYVKCHVETGMWAGRPKVDVGQERDFTRKTWKWVDPSRMGPGVLTDDQIKAALAASTTTAPVAAAAAPASAAPPTNSASPTPAASPSANPAAN